MELKIQANGLERLYAQLWRKDQEMHMKQQLLKCDRAKYRLTQISF